MKYHVEFDIDFKRNPYKGLYIVLEGIDGSGKTTQVDKLYEYFEEIGMPVVKTREPRKEEGIIGKLIQEILHGKEQIPSIAFQYLFSADREMHHEDLIIPALEEGKVVISDRCFWSAIPYGILDRGGKLDNNTANYMLVAQSILSQYHQFIIPDVTFYLDVPLSAAMKRIQTSGSTHEIYEDKKKLQQVLLGYEWLLKKFPKELVTIDAQKSVEEVKEDIIGKLPKGK